MKWRRSEKAEKLRQLLKKTRSYNAEFLVKVMVTTRRGKWFRLWSFREAPKAKIRLGKEEDNKIMAGSQLIEFDFHRNRLDSETRKLTRILLFLQIVLCSVNACREEMEGQAGVTLVKGTGTISAYYGATLTIWYIGYLLLQPYRHSSVWYRYMQVFL